jgi:hypothetical protein
VRLSDSDGVGVGGGVTVALSDSDGVGSALSDAVTSGVSVAVLDADGTTVRVKVSEADIGTEADSVARRLLVATSDADDESERDDVTLSVGVGGGVTVALTDTETDATRDADSDAVAVALADAVVLALRDAGSDAVAVALVDSVDVAISDADTDGSTEADALSATDCDNVTSGEPDKPPWVAENDMTWETVADAVFTDGDCVTLLLAENTELAVTVAARVADAVVPTDGVADTVLLVLRDADTDAAALALADGVLPLAVRDRVLADTVRVALLLADATTLPLALVARLADRVVDTVMDLPDNVATMLSLADARGDSDAVSGADSVVVKLRVSEAEKDASWLGVGVGGGVSVMLSLAE